MSREPVPNTCPDIDELIANVRAIQKECKVLYSETDNEVLLLEKISNIEHYVYWFEDKLNKLREVNSKLRDWGSGEASEVDYLTEKYENAQSIASDVIDGLCPMENSGLIELLKNI